MNSCEESKLLRLKDVSKLTSLGQSTINLWVAQGKFPKPKALSMTIKVWRMKDVISWIDKQYDDESNHENTLHESTPTLKIVNS
jgi:prophage regulatory protein